MRIASFVALAVTIAAGTALAQPPGVTPPSEPPPPPPPAAPGPGGQGIAPAQGDAPFDVDAMLAKVQAEAPTIETVARGTFRRARRAVSFGPTIGWWSGAFTQVGDFESAITFGLGLELFKVPVLPTPETLQALIMERVKAQATERIKAAFAGRPVEPIEAETVIKQIYEDVRREILGLENVRGKILERPRATAAVEVNRLLFGPEDDRWMTRVRVGVGVWKATVGLSLGVACLGGNCSDRIALYTGPEIVVHALTSKEPRASVVDFFLRFDLQATRRDVGNPYDHVSLGLRFLLDVI